ncbi:Major Facilitator Superfamily protein [Methylocapsa palsarum]|uniref:Major Facilitator Superfamily protein n=2 Tax=Methylocapsa palsarum TaxID=1612308 RepID=A0A1I3ZBN1_9HYPH|nr:Major Facilitator Superfamily protein [Methylocapsa palsarum]
MAAGFAFAVLSQILANTMLPLGGAFLSSDPSLATMPYAAFLVGAAAATFPASLLLDAFGRRAAFALGASLGAAGGLTILWALAHHQFFTFVLGAFWLGIANGFSLFYRHAAAMLAPGRPAAAIAVVFGSAAAAGLLAPTLAALAEQIAAPHLFAGLAGLSTIAQLCALIAAMRLPPRTSPLEHIPIGLNPSNRQEYARAFDSGAISDRSHDFMRSESALEHQVAPNRPLDWRVFACASIAGGLAWFAMAALMAAAPLAMAGCGFASTIVVGAIAWHVVAMYAPTLIFARLPSGLAPAWPAFAGAIVVALAAALFRFSTTPASFSASLVLLGIGWSFATTGATLWIHRGGHPGPWVLPAHDFILFASAVAGAVFAGRIVF